MSESERMPSAMRGSSEWICIVAVIGIAAIVYQPWGAGSLPLPDFGTFLPLIDRSDGVLTQLGKVVSFYASEGRLCLFPYMLFVFGANAFGTWAPGWYLTYFALNAVVISLFWFVLRGMGISRALAMLAAALWIPMTATTELWLRPTGEPFALIFFLSAVLLAMRYPASQHWVRDSFVIAALCVGVVYSKEILVTLLPAGWLVSRLSFSTTVPTWRPWARKDSILLAVAASIVGLALIPVAVVAATAPDGSYASGFGDRGFSGKVMWDRIGMIFLPTTAALANLRKISADPVWFLLLALPNLVWLRMLAGGIWKGRRTLVWPVAISLLWVGLGLLAYGPWTDPQTFYMAPFALGAMFGAAHVIRSLVSGSRVAAVGVVVLGLALVTISGVEAHTRMLRHRLRADLNVAVIERITEAGSPKVIAAVPVAPQEQRWGWARHLHGFASFSTGTAMAGSEDYTCNAARKALETNPGIVGVSRDRGCGRLSGRSIAIDRSTSRAQWPYLWKRHPVTDRIYITRSEKRVVGLLQGSR